IPRRWWISWWRRWRPRRWGRTPVSTLREHGWLAETPAIILSAKIQPLKPWTFFRRSGIAKSVL
ncbi:MAG: hypothetical protein WCF22_01885, partial [Candidatus Sulfotelmatobacter sp.]